MRKETPMESRELGQSGVRVSPIGVGTWPMSGAFWGPADDAESVRTIHRALELGVTLFDTAEGYGGGHAEEVLGRALAGRRAEAVIATKVSPTHLEPAQIRDAFANSCRRMNTDYLDVYFVHWPNTDLPIGPVMAELEAMRRAGQIRAIGVSNFTAAEMAEAQQHGRIDVLQPPYNLFWRFIEGDQLPYCRQHTIGVMTYSSLAQGLLTGHLTRATTFGEGDERPRTVLFQPANYGRCMDAIDQLRPLAARRGRSLAQLGIHWVINRPGVTTALLGARTVAEIEENAGGVGLTLSADDEAALDAAGRAAFEQLPEYLDMFHAWERNDLQRRRYQKQGRLPAAESAASAERAGR
jgi:aryl-alcohol dehydrogenase-like predicted oxidoreductase